MSDSTEATEPEFNRVCPLSEIPEGGAVGYEIDGHPVVIARSNGECFALKDVCSHEEVMLSEGEVDAGTIECWLHGSRFDLRTGSPLELPATESVDTYPVEIVDGEVYVSLQQGAAP